MHTPKAPLEITPELVEEAYIWGLPIVAMLLFEGCVGVQGAFLKHTGEEGAQELEVTFSDPDFSAEQSAFYYARVLENPTCRWTTLLANSAGKDLPDDTPATVQERGWSSPIWSASR